MAVVAKFIADFSNFDQAVQASEVKLQDFSKSIGRVDKDLAKFGDQFAGRKILQDATLITKAIEDMGGVSKLTDAEQKRVNATLAEAIAKYKVLGQDAPKAMVDLEQATRKAATTTEQLEKPTGFLETKFLALGTAIGTFVGNLGTRAVSALADWTMEAIHSAGAIVDLADKTGLSTDTIQRMEHVAKQTGSSMESMTDAAYKLGIRVASGSGSVKDAFDQLGLSIREVQSLSPDRQWDVVTEALSRVEDATRRNELGTAIFGKSFAGIAGSIAAGYRDIADGARLATDKQLRALDDAEDRWTSFVDNTKRGIASWLGSVIQAWDKGNEIWSRSLTIQFGSPEQLAAAKAAEKALTDVGAAAGGAERQVTDYVGKLAAARKELDDLTPAQRAQIKAALDQGVGLEKLSNDLGVSEEALGLFKDQQTKAAEATRMAEAEAKKFAEALAELNSAGDHLSGTLDGINGDVVESVKYYLQAGVSQNALATAYELTAAQVKAVAAALDLERRSMEANQKILAAGIAEDKAALDHWKEAARIRIDQSGTAVDAQIADIQRWRDDEIAKLDASGQDWQSHYDAIEAVAKAKTDSVMLNWAALKEGSKASLEQTALIAKNTFEYALAHADQYTAAQLANFEKQAQSAKQAAESWGQSYQLAGLTIIGAATQAADGVAAAGARITDASGTAAAGSQAVWSSAFQSTSAEMTRMTDGIITNATRIASEGGGIITNATKLWGESFKQAGMSWSEAMMAVNRGQGTMSGQIQNAAPSDEGRRKTQEAYDQGRYFGPVVGGTPQNPKGTGPDWAALGYRAAGGPVAAGNPYMVGEKGPELFVPDRSGGIVPNHAMGGGDVTINLTVSGPTFLRDRAAMQEFTNLVTQEIVNNLGRQRKLQAV